MCLLVYSELVVVTAGSLVPSTPPTVLFKRETRSQGYKTSVACFRSLCPAYFIIFALNNSILKSFGKHEESVSAVQPCVSPPAIRRGLMGSRPRAAICLRPQVPFQQFLWGWAAGAGLSASGHLRSLPHLHLSCGRYFHKIQHFWRTCFFSSTFFHLALFLISLLLLSL